MIDLINALFIGIGWCILVAFCILWLSGDINITHIDDNKSDIILRFKE